MPTRLRFARVAAVLCAIAAAAAIAYAAGSGAGEPAPVRTVTETRTPPTGVTVLRSRDDLTPPVVRVDRAPQRAGAARIFLSPRMRDARRDGRTHQQGALGLDEQGRTFLFRPAPDGEPMTDVRMQRYRGEPVLTWWQGAASKYGVGRGEGVIVDTRYRPVATVQAGNGQTVDLHEFLLTERGTALVTIYSRARRDLSALGGAKDAQVTEGVVQEIDVETGRVLFEWHSLDHVDPSESHRELPSGDEDSYDYFHINAVDELPGGDLLVTARHTSAVYRVDRETGDVVWRLGGERSDFAMGPGADFGLPHDARHVGDGVVQIFDNAHEADEGEEQAASSVKRIALDERRMRATLAERFDQPDGMWAESQGNAQALPGGGVLAGWGSTGAVSVFDARGRVRFDAHLPAAYDSYRAHLGAWRATPARPPAIHAERDGGQVTVFASWNGATEVRRWQVLAGPRPGALEPVGAPARWDGLETAIVRATEARYVAVAALDGAGRTLARSRAVAPDRR